MNLLESFRIKKGLTRAQLGSRVGVSRQQIFNIEKGNADPSFKLAKKIARAFDKSISDIFGG